MLNLSTLFFLIRGLDIGEHFKPLTADRHAIEVFNSLLNSV
jgi:hypothetical protein